MPTLKWTFDARNLRDAVFSVKTSARSLRSAVTHYKVRSRHVKNAIDSLNEYESKHGVLKLNDEKDMRLYRVISDITKAEGNSGISYTKYELRIATFEYITHKIGDYNAIYTRYGIPRRSFDRFTKQICVSLGANNLRNLRKLVTDKIIPKEKLKSTIFKIPKPNAGRPTLLTKDEETLVVATAELKVAHALPSSRKIVAMKLNEVLEGVKGRDIESPVKHKSKIRYAKRVIRRVNAREEEATDQRKRSTGEIKVCGLSHKRAKQGCPRLAWIMFHKICGMLRCIQQNERSHNTRIICASQTTPQEQQDMCTITTLAIYKPPQTIRVKQTITREDAVRNVEQLMTIPLDLDQIQPRPSQVWNCDEIGLDPNGNWNKIVCAYKWCNADQIWKAQTGERAPFWVTLLFFTRADGQCPIPPVIVHQSATLSADLLLGVPGDWIVHCTPSGYMDRDGWWKAIQQFCKLSGAHAGNNQALFFDGHDSHWDADALDMMSHNFVHGFFLKAGDSVNDQPNDNGFNAKAKSIYNDEKALWDEEYVTTPYSPPMMNKVMVKMWSRLSCEAGNTIKHSFAVTNLLPLKPPSTTEAAAHACVSAMQIGTGRKSTELSVIRERVMAPVQLLIKTTTDPHVIIRARNNESRNLLIRSAAYQIINKTTVIPAQKLKDAMQEIADSKKVAIPKKTIPTATRMNPDSSTGLYITAELRAEARIVSENKIVFNEEKARKQGETVIKKDKLKNKKAAAFDNILCTIKKTSGNTTLGLRAHKTNEDIKLVYQHLGGRLTNLPDGKRTTIESAIVTEFNAVVAEALVCPGQQKLEDGEI